MDRVVAKKGLPTRLKIAAGVVVVVALAAIFFWFAPRAGTQNVLADHVTLPPVTKGTFDDFIPLRARVTQLVTVYLDAVEGGRGEKRSVERRVGKERVSTCSSRCLQYHKKNTQSTSTNHQLPTTQPNNE